MNIYSEKPFCVYITTYSGNKLPIFYIGSTSTKRIKENYHGSVASKEYKKIWNQELKSNIHLFKTKIIFFCENRKESIIKEQQLQLKLNVVKNPLYINKSIASINGIFGVDITGKNHPRYGKKHSIDSRKKMGRPGRIVTSEQRKNMSEGQKKKIVINEIMFNSGREASNYFKVSPSSIVKWLKNGRANYI